MPRIRRNVRPFGKSPTSNLGSNVSKLHSVPLLMSPSSSANWPPLARKAVRLQSARPDVAAVIETLIDRYLADVS